MMEAPASQSETSMFIMYLFVSRLVPSPPGVSRNGSLQSITAKKKKVEFKEEEGKDVGFCCSLCRR